MADRAPSMSTRTRIGDYEVVAPLGAGGMATLYVAKKTGAAGFSRHVAIKVVHEHLASDRSFVELFLAEAKLSSQISHPNVVHVEDLGERDGLYFLVMEYVHGCSLADLMTQLAEDGRRPTIELACHIAIKVAEGLHAAHDALDSSGRKLGVVHRDVSPQNVLLSLAGDVKVIDFGIAKAVGRSQPGFGGIAGKLAYMAPEQATGRGVDRRCDVYALGVILWEMLTMSRLFTAHSTHMLLDRVSNPSVQPPVELVDDLPEGLSALVMHALSPSVDGRLATAGAFSRQLAKLVPGAASLQPSQLSALLGTLMRDRIESVGQRLPSEITVTRTKPADAADSTATLTLFDGRPADWTTAGQRSEIETLGLGEVTPSFSREELHTRPVASGGPWEAADSSAEALEPKAPRTVPLWLALVLAGFAFAALAALGVAVLRSPATETPATETASFPRSSNTGVPTEEPTEREAADAPAEDEVVADDVDALAAEDIEADEPEPAEEIVAEPASQTAAEWRRAARRTARRRAAARRAAAAMGEADDGMSRRIDGTVIVSDFDE